MDSPNRYSLEELVNITEYTSDTLRQFGFIIDSDQRPSQVLPHLNLTTIRLTLLGFATFLPVLHFTLEKGTRSLRRGGGCLEIMLGAEAISSL